MDAIERLARLFERFPGIGPRQAGRFVAYLLRSSPSLRRELVEAVQQLGSGVRQCDGCMRFHAGDNKFCSICSNPERDASLLAIVASDSDLAALERSGTYRGTYFVLGGTISLASENASKLRIAQLLARMSDVGRRSSGTVREVILAFPANPEGDATSIRIREELAPYCQGDALTITTLGRGLSTGSELEYADPETIKSALDSRR
jgi:recombination protein RecR